MQKREIKGKHSALVERIVELDAARKSRTNQDSTADKNAGGLSEGERSDLDRLLQRLRQLDGSWFEEAKIILELRDRRLYRENCATFEEFCQKELAMTRANINRRIRSGEIAAYLETNVSKPAKEAHIRPLLKLSDRAEQAECYRTAVETARKEERSLRTSDVSKAVKAVYQPAVMPEALTEEGRKSAQKRDFLRQLGNGFLAGLEQEDGPVLELLLHRLPGWRREFVETARKELNGEPTTPVNPVSHQLGA